MKNTILISFFLLIFFNISAFGENYPNIPKDIDVKNKTYCDKSGKKFGHVIVLLDLTSELEEPQIKFIKDSVFSENFFLSKKPFTRFSYLLIDNKSVQKQTFAFTKCRPKTGGSGIEKNTWTENSKYLKKFYNDFLSAAEKSHSKIFEKKINSPNSFIYETIAYVFQNPKYDFSEKVGERTLIIVSDMMQHSKRISFYKKCKVKNILNNLSSSAKCPTYKNFIKKLSTNDKDYLTVTAPKGKGVELKMIYLNNRYETKKEIDKSLVELWKNYFIDRNFKDVKIVRQLDIVN